MMSLSAAIRLGAMLKPQTRGKTSRGDSTCALGAALEAAGRRTDVGWAEVYTLWPMASRMVDYPGVEYIAMGSVMVGSACWLLNDADRWTREQIADWVESIEQQQEQPTTQAGAVTVPA